MTHNTREEPFLDLTDYGQYQVRINVDSRERGLELLREIKKTHHQLQKARHDWLREEIVKLEGMKMVNEHNSECLHNEAPEYCDCDNYIKWNQALQTIIDRYQAELDQDKV